MKRGDIWLTPLTLRPAMNCQAGERYWSSPRYRTSRPDYRLLANPALTPQHAGKRARSMVNGGGSSYRTRSDHRNFKEDGNLVQMCGLLWHKLISGEIRLQAIEAMTTEVA